MRLTCTSPALRTVTQVQCPELLRCLLKNLRAPCMRDAMPRLYCLCMLRWCAVAMERVNLTVGRHTMDKTTFRECLRAASRHIVWWPDNCVQRLLSDPDFAWMACSGLGAGKLTDCRSVMLRFVRPGELKWVPPGSHLLRRLISSLYEEVRPLLLSWRHSGTLFYMTVFNICTRACSGVRGSR